MVFLIILLPVYFYLGIRLSSAWYHWPLLFIPVAAILSFPFRKIFKYQIHLSYISMGVLTYLTVFTLTRDIIWITSGVLYPVIYVLVLTLICNILGFINAVNPQVKKIEIPVSPDSGIEGLTIVQISDLHIGPTIGSNYVSKIVKKINAHNPHAVVLTGDIGDGNAARYRADALPLKGIKSLHGTFYVPGNHEYYWNANEWLTLMNNIGIINVVNRGKVFKYNEKVILIAGIPDPVSGIRPDFSGIKGPEASLNADFKILLSHRPGIAPEADKEGFHLQLSGHTHGGQFFPWTIVVKFVHKLSLGLHKVGNMWLYISPGTGSWGPMLRLGTTPEISLIHFIQSNELALLPGKN